jgi:hypothetical protein
MPILLEHEPIAPKMMSFVAIHELRTEMPLLDPRYDIRLRDVINLMAIARLPNATKLKSVLLHIQAQ